MRERRVEAGLVELIGWKLPAPLSKGDHRHVGTRQMPYVFVSVDPLLDDFLADVAAWKED
jgi:hypothetical protein